MRTSRGKYTELCESATMGIESRLSTDEVVDILHTKTRFDRQQCIVLTLALKGVTIRDAARLLDTTAKELDEVADEILPRLPAEQKRLN